MDNNSLSKTILKEVAKYSADKAHGIKINTNFNRLPKKPNPLAFSKWYTQEVNNITSNIERIEDQFNIKTTCVARCNHCCKQPIFLCSTDVKIMLPSIKRMSNQELSTLKVRVEEVCKKISEIFGEVDIDVLPDNFKEIYFQENIPCVFVNAQGNCSIYDVRPTTCWAYRNYGSPSDCENNYHVETTIHYGDWESVMLTMMFSISNPGKKGLRLLPYVLKETLDRM